MPPASDQNIWLVIVGLIVLLARPAIALYLCGVSRSKYAASALMRSLLDFCVSLLAFTFCGRFIVGSTTGSARLLLPASLALLASGIASSAALERLQFLPPAILSLAMGGLVFPILFNWTQGGILQSWGFIDPHATAAIYVSGGLFALCGAFFAGPRQAKYNRDGSSNFIPAHHLPMTFAGIFMLVLCVAAARAGLGTLASTNVAAIVPGPLLGAAAGGLAAILFGQLRFGRVEAHLAISGFLSGAVATSALPLAAAPWACAILGAVAGIVASFSIVTIDLSFRLDDPAQFFATCSIGGSLGLIATALFAGSPRTILIQLASQLAGILVVAVLSLTVSGILCLLLRRLALLRLSETSEFDGDLAEFDLNAYPDFQQTMIKSYHLREA